MCHLFLCPQHLRQWKVMEFDMAKEPKKWQPGSRNANQSQRAAAGVKGKGISAWMYWATLLLLCKGSGEGYSNSSSHPEYPAEHLCMTYAFPFRMLAPNH